MTRKELMIEFANALESAGALARQIAECDTTIELKLDGEKIEKVYRPTSTHIQERTTP